MPGDPLSRPLIEIARELRDRRTSARELVEVAIARHERFGKRDGFTTPYPDADKYTGDCLPPAALSPPPPPASAAPIPAGLTPPPL
jgi:hypothetical protein